MTNNETLKDFTESSLSMTESSAGGKKVVKVAGRFQMCEAKNANGRVYPRKLWERVLGDEEIQNMISRRQMLGTVEHPGSGETSLDAVSHVITKLEMRGDEIYGEAELFDTPQGLIMQELARKNIPLGVSSRGKGKAVYENGAEQVDSDSFILETFDLVCKPSTGGAYTSVCESVSKDTALAADATEECRDTFINESADKLLKLRSEVVFDSRENLTNTQRELLVLSESLKELNAPNQDVTNFVNEVNESLKEIDIYEKSIAKIEEAIKLEEVSALRSALEEAKNEATYLSNRLQDARQESQEIADITRRCNAAATLAEETLGKLEEALSSLADLSAENADLKKRYEAAVELATNLYKESEGSEETQVQEAQENEYPELINFNSMSVEEETLSDLPESVQEDAAPVGIDASVLSFAQANVGSDEANENITESEISGASDRRASASDILKTESITNSPELNFLNTLIESTGGQ